MQIFTISLFVYVRLLADADVKQEEGEQEPEIIHD